MQGFQVSPAELEAHLLSLELIEDAGVIGTPDDRCGEVPVAFVVLSISGRRRETNHLESVKETIMRSVRETKVGVLHFSLTPYSPYQSEYKWLHAVYFVQAIPRLPSGKIIGKHLKGMLDGTKPMDVVIRPPVPTSLIPGSSASIFSRAADMLLKHTLY